MTLSRGERTGDDGDGGDGGDVVHGAGSDGVDNGEGDDDYGGNGDDVIDGAGIMLTMMVQLHLAKGSRRVEKLMPSIAGRKLFRNFLFLSF